jgi:hypothetical protein
MFVVELRIIVHPGLVRKLRKIFKKLAFIKMQKNLKNKMENSQLRKQSESRLFDSRQAGSKIS